MTTVARVYRRVTQQTALEVRRAMLHGHLRACVECALAQEPCGTGLALLQRMVEVSE